MNSSTLEKPSVDPSLFPLDSEVSFLNHGSFGSCPIAALEYQQEIRDRLEKQPVQFYQRDFEPMLDSARASLSEFVGCPSGNLVFVPNATEGVNTVLRSLKFKPGDELLVSNHEYNACRNAIYHAGERQGADVRTFELPFPVQSESEIVEAALAQITPATRLLLIDHVTSQTGLVLPIKAIIQAFAERGIDTLVDGAHAPGMIHLDLESLGAAYYSGNCHKWICAPKTAGFLYVRSDRRQAVRPLTISHGANSPRTDRSRFLIEFGWMGTRDPSAVLTAPFCINYLGNLLPGGWPEVMERNRSLALAGRDALLRALGIQSPAPESMIGSLASVPLPDSNPDKPYRSLKYLDILQEGLWERYKIEVPILAWPKRPQRLVRISAQLYNSLPQYESLGKALVELLANSESR